MEEKHHHNCDCHTHTSLSHTHCSCNSDSNKINKNETKNAKLSKYKDFEFDDNNDFSCDLDPTKICDNCGKCLDAFNTDKDGYVQIQIDKIEKGNSTLHDLYKMYGLDDND